MSKKIKPEELQKEVMDYLKNGVEDIEEDVREVTDIIIKEAKKELVLTSPKSGIARKTKYYRGWAIKTGAKTKKRT